MHIHKGVQNYYREICVSTSGLVKCFGGFFVCLFWGFLLRQNRLEDNHVMVAIQCAINYFIKQVNSLVVKNQST